MGKANDCGTCHDACPCRMAIVRELIAAMQQTVDTLGRGYCPDEETELRMRRTLDAARKAGLDAK